MLTSNSFVTGAAKLSKTSLISVHNPCDLNSCRYLLNSECAVLRTPLMMWKSPESSLAISSFNRSGHLSGKSSRPIILMASLNWKKNAKISVIRIKTYEAYNKTISDFIL